MLRWLGHRSVAVLDGGCAVWLREGRPVTAEVRAVVPATFIPRPSTPAVDVNAVAANLSSPSMLLLDARGRERFRGDVEPIDRVPGHIPGATNHFFKSNVADDGTFKSTQDLRSAFNASGGGVPTDHLVCYCGSGVTACQNLLALEHAGLHGAKLYAGSWSEWSSDPARPTERG